MGRLKGRLRRLHKENKNPKPLDYIYFKMGVLRRLNELGLEPKVISLDATADEIVGRIYADHPEAPRSTEFWEELGYQLMVEQPELTEVTGTRRAAAKHGPLAPAAEPATAVAKGDNAPAAAATTEEPLYSVVMQEMQRLQRQNQELHSRLQLLQQANQYLAEQNDFLESQRAEPLSATASGEVGSTGAGTEASGGSTLAPIAGAPATEAPTGPTTFSRPSADLEDGDPRLALGLLHATTPGATDADLALLGKLARQLTLRQQSLVRREKLEAVRKSSAGADSQEWGSCSDDAAGGSQAGPEPAGSS